MLQTSKQHIVVTPEKLAGLNLRALFHVVVQYTYEINTLHELPKNLLTCCEALENGACTLYSDDLLEVLPVAVEKLMDPEMAKMLSLLLILMLLVRRMVQL